MIQVVDISNGQKNQLENKKWRTKVNKNGKGQDVEDLTYFNPRTVIMIGDSNETHFVSIEEQTTGIENYQWLKTRPLVDYNPIEEEII